MTTRGSKKTGSTRSSGSKAKSSTSKSGAAKKQASKKQASKKTPAATKRSTASGKTAAKKSPTPTSKKSASAASTTKPRPKAPAKKPVKSPFKVNDRVVYPHHGAAIIKSKEKRKLDGVNVDYFVIEAITNPLTLRIPVEKATELGLRPVISKNAARKVFGVLKEDPVEADATWARWFKLLQDKMSSGDIYEVASVVRDLTYAQQSKPLGPALKRMLAKARLILTSELQLALDIDEESSIKRLDRALDHLIVELEDAEELV